MKEVGHSLVAQKLALAVTGSISAAGSLQRAAQSRGPWTAASSGSTAARTWGPPPPGSRPGQPRPPAHTQRGSDTELGKEVFDLRALKGPPR